MLSVQGYYDGSAIRPLEEIVAKPNQRVLIMIMDDFLNENDKAEVAKLRGALSKYANPALIEKEKGAWQNEAQNQHSG